MSKFLLTDSNRISGSVWRVQNFGVQTYTRSSGHETDRTINWTLKYDGQIGIDKWATEWS